MLPFSGRLHHHPEAARAGRAGGFTLIELLTVITIIVILVGLIVGVAGFANTKASRARAEAEIKALSTALESYKSDHAVYPRDANTTDQLYALSRGDPEATQTPTYAAASKFLYAQLTGQDAASATYPPQPAAGAKVYFEFKPGMLGGNNGSSGFPNGVTGINDPWGMSYGYSTVYAADLDKNPTGTSRPGYNPTFDLWSVANRPTSSPDTTSQQALWITNW